jgi:PAS domain S-box-containing protein
MNEVRSIIDKNKESMIIPDGMVVIGKELQIVAFNEAAERITGFKQNEIVGESYSRIVKKDENYLNYFEDCLNNGTAYSNLSIDLLDCEGNAKNVLASITPVSKESKIISAVFVFRDTEEMLYMAEELASKTSELLNEKNKLEAIFNSNIEGTFTIDKNWNITSFNNAAVDITGYKKSEAIGEKCWNIFKSSLCRNGCHMEKTMKRGTPTIGNELEIVRKDGKRVPIRVNSGILRNNKNEKMGAVETFIDISEIKNLSEHLSEKYEFGNIVGRSKQMEKVFSLFESVSQTDSSVLITGESGTGKELAARAIHLNSPRKNGPFIALNCSAFAESLIESELFGHEEGAFTGAVKQKIGRFELAQGGTLFLDEIGDISIPVQTKLLRVLDTRQFERVGGNKPIKMDTRIIVATNKDLNEEIKAGRFREDLLYRINVMNIHLPPLRERLDDLPLLIDHFIKNFNEKFNKSVTSVSADAYKLIENYDWPGNIRELENVIEHSFILCDDNTIKVEHLPDRLKNQIKPAAGPKNHNNIRPLEDVEKETILNLLEKHNRVKKKVAEELNINPSTLWRKMKKYRIS